MQARIEVADAHRRFFARFITLKAGARDPRIEEAFASVRRERFAGPGPWQIRVPGGPYIETPDSDPAYLYYDWLVALDAARGINIGEPALHARCLDALSPQEGETVLHVGAGAGYYTAMLAALVGAPGRVHAFEIVPELARRARENLAALSQVEVHERSGTDGALPAADVVYVNASATHPSRRWLDALRPGGRLMVPLHATGGFGGVLMTKRPASGPVWPARFVSPAGFIACEGVQDDAEGKRLTAAFAELGWRAVQSLQFGPVDAVSCWFAGDGWWLSTAAPGGE